MLFVSTPAKPASTEYSFHQENNTTSVPFRITCYQDSMTSSNGLLVRVSDLKYGGLVEGLNQAIYRMSWHSRQNNPKSFHEGKK